MYENSTEKINANKHAFNASKNRHICATYL